MTTIAEYLDIARDARLAGDFEGLTQLSDALNAEHGPIILHTAIVPLTPIVCPFAAALISTPHKIVPLACALRRAAGPYLNMEDRYAMMWDVDWLIDDLDENNLMPCEIPPV